MKKISHIQDKIKNREEMSIFIDFNDVFENILSFSSEVEKSRGMRIANNFAEQPFIKMYILVDNNSPQQALNTIERNIKNAVLVKYDSDNFNNLCDEISETSEVLYIGNNSEIINTPKFQEGITLSIFPIAKDSEKLADIRLSKQKFTEALLETNNICL